jgi:hypothetical protein
MGRVVHSRDSCREWNKSGEEWGEKMKSKLRTASPMRKREQRKQLTEGILR